MANRHTKKVASQKKPPLAAQIKEDKSPDAPTVTQGAQSQAWLRFTTCPYGSAALVFVTGHLLVAARGAVSPGRSGVGGGVVTITARLLARRHLRDEGATRNPFMHKAAARARTHAGMCMRLLLCRRTYNNKPRRLHHGCGCQPRVAQRKRIAMSTDGDTNLITLVLEGRRCDWPTSSIPGVAEVDLVDGLVTRRRLTARGGNDSLGARVTGQG